MLVTLFTTSLKAQRILDAGVPRREAGAGSRLAAGGAAIAFTGTLAVIVAPQVDAEIHGDVPAGESAGERAARAPALAFTSSLIVGELFVETGPVPFVLGDGIDLALVAKEVDKRRGDLHACYQRRLAVNPELAGEVIIHAGIDRDGSITEQCITSDTVGDQELIGCVNDLLAASTFPGAKGEHVDVSFPFAFEPSL